MSRWKSNFDNQQALQKVQSVLDVLQSERLKSKSISSPAKEEFDRAIKVLKLIEVRLSTLDPELFHQNSWGSFPGWLNNAKSHADAFCVNLNQGNIQNLNNILDEILNVLKPIDGKFSDEELSALTQVNERFNQQFLGVLEQVRKKADEIQKQYDSLSAEISQGKVRLDKNDQAIESQKTRLDSSIAEFQKQFSTAQETRNLEFQKSLTQLKTAANDQSKAIEENSNTASESCKSEWNNFLAGSLAASGGDCHDNTMFIGKRRGQND